MKKSLVLPFLLLAGLSFAQSQVSGYVYLDQNSNNKKESRERGLEGIAVSNGQEVVLTDSKGRYSLSASDDMMVFVIKPSGYKTPLSPENLNKFYYNHKPQGSPKNFKYQGVAPTGKLPKEVNFGLQKQEENNDFQILVFGDPQPYTLKEMDYFKRGIVDEVKNNKRSAVFGISLGDLVGDDLVLHDPYKEIMKEIGLPWYNVIGNHDMNLDATNDLQSDETFERNFGPANYAFNYANVHFIVLDNILYPDPRDQKGYYGGFREGQLKFIENDLKHVDKDKLVVLAFHIQMNPEREGDDHFRMEDRAQLFKLLEPFSNVLMMSAHTHKQTQIYYGKGDGWNGAKELHELNMGTTSGDWYSGTVDQLGVPKSVIRDGTYRGYSFVNFTGNKYQVDYKVAGHPEDYMIKLHVPKVISSRRSSARIYANFFTGSERDTVEYRIDRGEWKKMSFLKAIDPNYMLSVFEWDNIDTLKEGRRPSNPEPSNHVWSAGFPSNLSVGTHKVEVRAKDQYGKVFTSTGEFKVEDLKMIP